MNYSLLDIIGIQFIISFASWVSSKLARGAVAEQQITAEQLLRDAAALQTDEVPLQRAANA